jgi:hypothetical protein
MQAKKEENKNDDKIPNSLIINIKTRIPNHYKITYDPSMTIPMTKSTTVYFDPLVKYYEGPIKSIPYASDDAIYNQFFDSAAFETMINRILSDFRYMQKPTSLKDAYDNKTIDNNMELTLKTLFKPNGLFYINKEPYTIVGRHWNANDWLIDKKPIDKLLAQFPFMSQKQLEEDATKEENLIPDAIRQGNLSMVKPEESSIVVSGLEKASAETDIMKEEEQEESFVPIDKLPGLSDDIKRIYSENLQKNIPINFSETPDIKRDPLTLTLLISPKDLIAYINKQQTMSSSVVGKYSAYITAKSELQKVEKEYQDSTLELAHFKQDYINDMDDLRDFIEQNKPNINASDTIEKLIFMRTNYMRIIFDISESMNQIYLQQKQYYTVLRDLLVEIKYVYKDIIPYYKIPELALKCIEYDIANASAFIEINPENPYSKSYFTNYQNFTYFYEFVLLKNKNYHLTPNVNYADELKKYIEDPNLLLVEKSQYDVYDLKQFSFYYHNQYDIWINMFKSLTPFISFVSSTVVNLLNIAEEKSEKLNNKYDEATQQLIKKRLSAEGLRADYSKDNKALKWYFVKNDGTKALISRADVKSQIKKVLGKQEEKENETFQSLYIENAMSQVKTGKSVCIRRKYKSITIGEFYKNG